MSWVNRMSIAAMAAFAVLAIVSARPAVAKDDDVDKDWKVLGEAKVEKRTETDEIKVGADEGVFKRIKLKVRGADVEFKKVTVVYESGDNDEIEIRDKVKRGEETRPISLKGRNRAIKKVIFVYKAEGDVDRGAGVILLGNK